MFEKSPKLKSTAAAGAAKLASRTAMSVAHVMSIAVDDPPMKAMNLNADFRG